MLVFRCECDEVLSAETGKAGKLGECPGCGKILRIPEKAFEFTKLTLKRPDATIRVPKPPTTSVKLGDPKKLESKPAPPAPPPPPAAPPAPKEAAKALVKESAKAEAKAPPPAPPKEAAKAEAKPPAPKEATKADAKPPAAEKSGKKSGEFTLPPAPPSPPPTPMPRPTSAAEEAAEEDEELKRVVQRSAPRERKLDGKPFTNVRGSSGLPMKIILAVGGIGILAGIAYFAGLFGGKTEPEIPKKQPPAPIENKAATPVPAPATNKTDDKKADTQ